MAHAMRTADRVKVDDLAEAARMLRAVLVAVERGELEAPAGMVAYLSGAADSASVVAERMNSARRP